VDGPLSVVCGQFATRDQTGGYGRFVWLYAGVKRGQVLWTDIDDGAVKALPSPTGRPGRGRWSQGG
jgi:hypothetical protein